LTEDPFNLDWGMEVVSTVTIRYANGKTLASEDGGEAVLITKPDPPTGLTEDETKRTSVSIGATWSEPVFGGGAEYLSYRVWQKYQGGSFKVVQEVRDVFIVLVGLTPGQTYYYVVQTLNDYGDSEFSEEFSLVCAFTPNPPRVVSTENAGANILTKWSDVDDNGSDILSYEVYAAIWSGETFEQISTNNCIEGPGFAAQM
jgi:hypothetical protein